MFFKALCLYSHPGQMQWATDMLLITPEAQSFQHTAMGAL